jgi:hypothetical protein
MMNDELETKSNNTVNVYIYVKIFSCIKKSLYHFLE